jgi:hypothetical protein
LLLVNLLNQRKIVSLRAKVLILGERVIRRLLALLVL